MATIKDVAALAGVSISTVSNVLNNNKYVSQATADKVKKAVDELSFSLNITARNMRAKSSMMIGVVLPSISRVFYSQVMAGMNEVANKAGYSMVLYSSEYDLKKEKKFMHNLLQNKVDGIIISSIAGAEDKEYLQSLSSLHYGDKKVHVVSISRDLTEYGINSVAWDNKAGSQMAIQTMIDHGARRILCMSSSWPGSSQQRVEGYRAALEANGIAFDPNLCVREEASAWAGYSATVRLLNDGVAFDGVFAGNDQRAVGAIKAIQERGLKIPENILVVGFDNSMVSSLIQPPLTTVNVPKRRLGREAVTMILQCQKSAKDSEDSPRLALLPLQLVERASTNSALTTAWELEDW